MSNTDLALVADVAARNTILYGPPGTGKTYSTILRAVAIIDGAEPESMEEAKARWDELRGEGRIEFVTFHQSYGYEDFVEGIRPIMTDEAAQTPCYEVFDGILKQVALRALEAMGEGKRYVLVIDEINRGNISKIFGELITLIEDDKRIGADLALTVTFPHSRDSFGLPANLYLLGTMNTADKRIALVDVALRRRFEFEEMLPRFAAEDQTCPGLSSEMRDAITRLNKRIVLRKDRDHQIGHAFFRSVGDTDSFNGDWESLRWVLGDDNEAGARNRWQWYRDAGQTLALLLVRRLRAELKLSQHGAPIRRHEAHTGDFRAVRGRLSVAAQITRRGNRRDTIASMWNEFLCLLPGPPAPDSHHQTRR